MKVNYFGLRLNKGVTVATFVTTAPRRHAFAQPSTLGVLHSRSRLGSERITSMLAGAPFTVRPKTNNTWGLLLELARCRQHREPNRSLRAPVARSRSRCCDY